jgi:CDP-glucose 4,6-dehydratase
VGDVAVGDEGRGWWFRRTVLITGAAGLLGGWVARELLDSGASVLGLDIAWDGPRATIPPTGVERIDGDVRNTSLLRDLLSSRHVDTTLHLAAQTLVGPALEDPVDTFRNNIEGSWSVLEACRSTTGVRRIVVASSDKAYGDASGRPYREEMPLRPHHPYDTSKAVTDLLAQTYAHTYGLPVAITRCGNLYGGGDLNWSRIIPGTIRSVVQGEAPVIRSDGTFVRDYLYVRDAAAGVLTLADAIGDRPEIAGTAFNFAASVRWSVIDLVRRILELMDSELEPVVLGLPLKEIPEQRVSAARARRLLGWRPRASIESGLRETIDWYRGYFTTAA